MVESRRDDRDEAGHGNERGHDAECWVAIRNAAPDMRLPPNPATRARAPTRTRRSNASIEFSPLM
jgi:hypothetical protein